MAHQDTKLEVQRFGPENVTEFYKFHNNPSCRGCFCVAWYVPSWDGWSQRTPGQNQQFRETLIKGGHYDGYLLFLNQEPIGWLQATTLRTMPKLAHELGLHTDLDTHVIGCLSILPQFRKKKLSRALLAYALQDLQKRGVKNVLAVPKVQTRESMSDETIWTGPEKLFKNLGFEEGEIVSGRRVYFKAL